MPMLNEKRQITLTKDQCRAANLHPGDEYESIIDDSGHIKIIRLQDKDMTKVDACKMAGPGPETI